MKNKIEDIIGFYRRAGLEFPLAQQRCAQDILLSKIAASSLKRHVTIKGGVVIYERSQALRRATMDVDLDFVHFGIDEESLLSFVSILNAVDDGITLKVIPPLVELHHEDYRGKRMTVRIGDSFGGLIPFSKIDVGVETLGLNQQVLLSFHDIAGKLIEIYANCNEQIFAEKLISLLRHGVYSTRYKDVADMVYLVSSPTFDKCRMQYFLLKKLRRAPDLTKIREKTFEILKASSFRSRALNKTNYWVDVPFEKGLQRILWALEK